MLKRFFFNALSSFLGAWVALVVFGVVAIMAIAGIIAKIGLSNNTTETVKKDSVLVISLEGEIIENDQSLEFDYSSFIIGDEIVKKKSLKEITSAIEAAAENKNIKAIYLKCDMAIAAPATYNAIRNSLLKFKESGKKIISYSNIYQQGPYYVATVADQVYLNPGGSVYLKGLGGVTLFYKDLLDKLGIEVQMVKVGTYKSAVEPYVNTSMSQPAKAQLDTLYGSMWKYIREGIASQRKNITAKEIDSLVNSDFIFLKKGKDALKYGLIDDVVYERSMDSIIASSINKKRDDLNFVNPTLLISQEDILGGYNAKTQIAVLYASGEIFDGGGNATINYERFVPIITSLADNDNVKGMVLRVNSPGGSVFGSQQIGEALDYFQSKGKPLAVSMGDYAASGGYWISCKANRIFADALTVTGSIGIFGLIPNIERLLHKVGLNPQLVSTNPEAAFPNLYNALNERQLAGMQQMVSEGYDEFIARVAEGRKMPESKVRKIGEGRVWDANSALRIGLIDSLGGLEDAITWVANEISSDNYTLSYYPKQENTVWDFLPALMNMQVRNKMIYLFGDELPMIYYEKINNILTRNPIQAKMPDLNVIL